MKIREIMTRNVQCVGPEASLTEAASMLRKMDVGALPVCQDDRVIGMVTDRDIVIRCIAQGSDPNECVVRDAMSEDVFYCYEDQDIEDAALLMEEKQIRRLPIFDRHMKLTGIVSLGDLAVDVGRNELSGEVLERVSEPAHPIREPAW